MEAYAVAQRDSVNDAALAAVEALGALAARGVPVARSFFLRFPRSEDPLVRAAVARRLDDRAWGSTWPAETGRPDAFYREVIRELVAPDIEDGARPRGRVHTANGSFTIELLPAAAPLTVHNFLALARRGFFDGARWHRAVPNFVLQGGDPRGDGEGGPGFAIRDEINRIRYLRGTLGMALSGPDTGGRPFFLSRSSPPIPRSPVSMGDIPHSVAWSPAPKSPTPSCRMTRSSRSKCCHEPIALRRGPPGLSRALGPARRADRALRQEQDPVPRLRLARPLG